MLNLVVTTPGFLACLAALFVAFLVWAGRQWFRGRWVAAAVFTICAVAFGLVTAADFVNADYQYLPQVRDVADTVFPGVAYPRLTAAEVRARHMRDPHGGVVRIALPDGRDGFGRSHELAYVPKAYFTAHVKLPVVYLLHGSPGSAEDWFRAAHAASVGKLLDSSGHPAVLVAAEMSNGWTQDSECVDGIRLRAETHLLNVILPTTERTLQLATDRNARVLAGNSAGGYCALNIGLRHRDLFGTIVDLSGYTKPTHDGGLAALFGSGPAAARGIAANSPAVFAPALPAGLPVRIWFDAGSSDHDALGQQRALANALGHREDMTVRVVVRVGGHTYGVWRPALRDALLWATPASALRPGKG